MDHDKYQDYAYQNADFLFLGGSQAYGTTHEGSDEDIRGVFFAPAFMLTNPFIDFKTGTVKHTGHEDTVLWEMGEFMRGLTTSPDKMDALFAPKDCWVKKPGSAMQLLIKNREAFLTQKIAQALLGHGRRDLAILKKGVKPTKAALVKPDPLDYLFTDTDMTKKLASDFPIKESGGGGMYLESKNSRGDQVIYNLYQNPRGKLVAGEGNLAPTRKGSVPAGSEFIQTVCYDRRGFDDANRAYRDRLVAPERSSAKAALAELHGFDTKTAANSLRCIRMAHELVMEGKYQVRRPDAQELLDIRNHASRPLESILKEAQTLNDSALEWMSSSPLPADVDYERLSKLHESLYRTYITRKPGLAHSPSP